MTTYQLLTRTGQDEGWKEWREEEAASPRAAIKKAYMRGDTQDVVEVVAVPKRNWKPEPIRVEVAKSIIWGERPASPPKGPGKEA